MDVADEVAANVGEAHLLHAGDVDGAPGAGHPPHQALVPGHQGGLLGRGSAETEKLKTFRIAVFIAQKLSGRGKSA